MAAAVCLLSVTAEASAEPRFLKGPYLMDVRPDSVAVLFELSEPSAATIVATGEAGDERRVTSAETAFHEIVVDGLAPRTAYTYRVEVQGTRAEGSFSTAPPPGEGPIEVLVMGDNRTDAAAHRAVVHAMRRHPADFVLNTGDMVAHGDDPEDWARMFEIQGPLLAVTPLFPTLGNHELYESGRGLDSFLKYTRVPRELGGAETYYAFTYGPARFLILDSNEAWDGDGEQRRWLVEQLRAAREDPHVQHVFLAMHHGPFSSGNHGGHPGMNASDLPAVLREHGVSLILSGHDHLYERGSVDGLKYIVTGGGGAPLYPVNNQRPGQLAFEATYHFLRMTIDGESVSVTAIRPDGSEIERCGFVADGPWTCEDPPGDDPAAGPVQAGIEPAAFHLRRYLEKPIVWMFAAVVLLGLGALVILRRRRT